MKSIIIGGGKIGSNLFKTLREKNHEVTLIERDKDTCLRIAEDTCGDVIWGDGTDLEILKEAGIEDAEIIAAVTGTDEENLVICKIAKVSFNTPKTIARVNNPKNTTMFKTLGIDNTVCSTEVIANLIDFELNKDNCRIIRTFENGSMILVEILTDSNNNWCNREIKDLQLPDECIIVSVLREENIIYPRGNTKILNGDKVLALTNNHVLTHLIKNKFKGVIKNA